MLVSFTGSANAADVKDILRTADDFRIYAQSAKVVTQVELYKDDALDGERLYHVYVKPGRRSLVLFKTASELGQKMLMLDDKYWLMLPSSKRPLRITATQKLLGEASVGDIATMTWSEDYSGTIVGQESMQGVAATKLELRSAREGTTYDRIVLWVRADNFQPLQAELYLASGKLAKIARYELGQLQGRAAIVRTYLQDRIQLNRRTVLQYRSIEEAQIPDKLYNPAYLVRENLESW
jgi:outer membrane lipoprotein-sorting protein